MKNTKCILLQVKQISERDLERERQGEGERERERERVDHAYLRGGERVVIGFGLVRGFVIGFGLVRGYSMIPPYAYMCAPSQTRSSQPPDSKSLHPTTLRLNPNP